MENKQVAIIIGANPACLTAGLELQRQSTITPIIFEELNQVGGLSRTVNYNGNRIDIGGHRFFSKSDWVMEWWQNILPLDIGQHTDNCFLTRSRLSRIYFLRKFFDYPIRLNARTLFNLGFLRVIKIGISYILSSLFPHYPENSLEDFFVNRFGKELYFTFFKDYTEKVWGVRCTSISPSWGAQRIKGLSVSKALFHALKKNITRQSIKNQNKTQTSLFERFLYPKYGPGQLWERVAEEVSERGGTIELQHQVTEFLFSDEKKLIGIKVLNVVSREEKVIYGDYFISTMPVKNLIQAMGNLPPDHVKRIAGELPYRDFTTVGLLAKKLKKNAQSQSAQDNNMPPDNWIYIQENDVKVGRLQIFNNWSPYLIKNPENIWLGLEYFCQENDALWSLSDDDLIAFGINELITLDLLESKEDIIDSIAIRVPKAYPAYFGSYSEFNSIREFSDSIDNLFLIGRNGMHKYNNQDHSMLTARYAVEGIISGNHEKHRPWNVNVDDDYQEEK
ncbi:MAG: NAD(P)/FAD-dependent oxidoreductase [Methylococcales bacterium]|nr:NAD(P)/FAD-dependent oxidoreductase [Methylococcales bacterium]